MPNEINSSDDAIRQTFAHELGHLLYAFSVGTPWAQIDIQVVTEAETGFFLLPARTSHLPLGSEFHDAAVGVAGVVAQELFLNPDLDDAALFESARQHPSLSGSDRRFERLPQEQQRAALEAAAQTIRAVLPIVTQQVELLHTDFRARYDAGATSAGYLYNRSNPELIPRVVPILADLSGAGEARE